MRLKNIIFIIAIGLLFLPLLQMNFNLLKLDSLRGSYTITEKPDSISKNWFSKKYQIQYDKYFNDHLGYRPFFVRINNQIKYTLFSKLNTVHSVLGKNKQIFQSDYIDAYLGTDYVGKDKVKNGFERIEFIQKRLKKHNIDFILVFAPGKASFMPENIPEIYHSNKKGTTNYDEYISLLNNSSINFIDFRKYFNSIKDTSKYPLFPKNGAHWSGYASTLASDSLSKYISLLMKINMVKHKDIGGYTTNNKLIWTDDELSKTLNIFEKIEHLNMYYPNIQYIPESNSTKPNTLFIGDSYLQSFYGFYPYFENCFGENTAYWNYGYTLKWRNKKIIKDKVFVYSLNIPNEILSKKLIVLLVTQANIKFLDNLFTEKLYQLFKKNNDIFISENEIQFQIKKIRNNKEWISDIKKQAQELSITIDSMLTKAALYTIRAKRK